MLENVLPSCSEAQPHFLTGTQNGHGHHGQYPPAQRSHSVGYVEHPFANGFGSQQHQHFQAPYHQQQSNGGYGGYGAGYGNSEQQPYRKHSMYVGDYRSKHCPPQRAPMQPPYSASQNPPQSSGQQQHFMHAGYDNSGYGNSGYGNSVNYGNPHQQQGQMMSPPSYQHPPQMMENGGYMMERKTSTATHDVYEARKFSNVDQPPTLDLYPNSNRLQPPHQQPHHYGHSPNHPIPHPQQQQQQYQQSGYAPRQMTAAAPSSSSGDSSGNVGGASNSLYANADAASNSERLDSLAVDCSASASARDSMDTSSNHFPSTSRKMSAAHDYSMNGGAFMTSNGAVEAEDAMADAKNRSFSAAGVNCAASSSETDSMMLIRRKSMQRQQPLNRYNSQLRQGRYSTAGLGSAYTPPPILSPMRNGSGLFWKLAKNLGEFNKNDKKDEPDDEDVVPPPVKRAKKMSTVHFADETESEKPEVKIERRDSYDDDDRLVISEDEPNDEAQSSPPFTGSERKESIELTASPGAAGPQRKNGLFLAGESSSDGGKAAFAAELEALRKDSETSTKSMPLSARDLSQLRKFSSMSADGSRSLDRNRKLSTLSSVSDSSYYEYLEGPMHIDATPHINLGKNFQARVKKWKDREITQLERDAIPDRDECVFDCQLIDHLPQSAVAAYEALSNSKAVPRPGRNKELALHLLMENKGNIQSSVMDLMRSDTLDWVQYPIIFNSTYLDTEYWSPEDIQRFQDAIYSTEKDFHLMANEMGNKSVKQLIEFYYTWKKACPDDYRKLRNLRRKRQLLEQQMCGVEELPPVAQQVGTCEDSDMTSDAESDATNPSFMMNSDQALINDEESDKLAAIASAVSPLRKRSGQLDENNGFSYWHQQHQRQQMKNEPLMVTPPQSSNNGPFAAFGMHSPSMLLQVNVNGSTGSNPASSPDSISLLGAGPGSVGGLSSLTQKHVPRAAVKKGAQPSADGFFHCRLCDKRFEKVKSLNAHMKSHAMKARAEAEALAQKNQQQGGGMTPQSQQPQGSSMGVQRQSQPNVPNPFNLTAGSPSAAGVPPGLLNNFDAALMAARQSAAALSRFGPLAAAAATSQAGLLNADLFANLMSNPQMHSSALQQLQNASAHNMMMFDQKSQV
ncbi:hypothetical protein QR680_005198 [Steinernema hermaphroditum]|uniref:C2H2-type domain-containing protein n=1 Tax=Steinernema hermaphroditum TaxID=289476 RepID=A0AA39HS89_9BILA|nr:hypothetical protein QR680_005198 [Steinernema hermaphroditum]